MNDAENVLKLISNSNLVGMKESEIADELNLKISDIRPIIRNLFEGKIIYRSLSENRWKLVKFRTENETDYNSRMHFTAG